MKQRFYIYLEMLDKFKMFMWMIVYQKKLMSDDLVGIKKIFNVLAFNYKML